MIKTIVLNIIKQANKYGTPFMNYIRGRGVRAGLTKEDIEIIIGELLAEERIEEKEDENGVIWYALKPETIELDWKCANCDNNRFVDVQIPGFRGGAPVPGMKCVACQRVFLKNPPNKKDVGKSHTYRHIHTEFTSKNTKT